MVNTIRTRAETINRLTQTTKLGPKSLSWKFQLGSFPTQTQIEISATFPLFLKIIIWAAPPLFSLFSITVDTARIFLTGGIQEAGLDISAQQCAHPCLSPLIFSPAFTSSLTPKALNLKGQTNKKITFDDS